MAVARNPQNKTNNVWPALEIDTNIWPVHQFAICFSFVHCSVFFFGCDIYGFDKWKFQARKKCSIFQQRAPPEWQPRFMHFYLLFITTSFGSFALFCIWNATLSSVCFVHLTVLAGRQCLFKYFSSKQMCGNWAAPQCDCNLSNSFSSMNALSGNPFRFTFQMPKGFGIFPL